MKSSLLLFTLLSLTFQIQVQCEWDGKNDKGQTVGRGFYLLTYAAKNYKTESVTIIFKL